MPDRRPPPARRPGRPRPEAGRHEVATGTAEILADWDDPEGWFVMVNGVPSSYVHLGDPTRLEFEYVRWVGDALDLVAGAGEPLRVLHLGGAGCTLARYVAATRPGSSQLVFEHDAELAGLMRTAFGPPGELGYRIRTVDARAGLAALPAGSRDVVIRDAFVGATVPAHLTTVEFCRDVARVLAPGGVYLANVADQARILQARTEAATMCAVFGQVALVAEPAQLRGRRFGNVVLVASDRPLPVDALTRRLASGAVRGRLVAPDRIAELVAGISIRSDP
ncbi:MAG TPA: fused MFS/spermidine synthase [Mycobacteriales bacterium]|nr:fused MFS/spermidine synthase [Mycobacteriales bacterium]